MSRVSIDTSFRYPSFVVMHFCASLLFQLTIKVKGIHGQQFSFRYPGVIVTHSCASLPFKMTINV